MKDVFTASFALFIALLLIAPVSFAVLPKAANPAFPCERNLISAPELFQVIERGQFEQSRSLQDYVTHSDGRLQKVLDRLALKSDVTIIDAGAGHALALRQILHHSILLGQTPPYLFAFGYKIPRRVASDIQNDVRISKGRFAFATGKQTDISVRAWPRADLIMDVFGIYTYYDFVEPERDREEILTAYLNRLKKNGVLYISGFGVAPASLAKVRANKRYNLTLLTNGVLITRKR